MAPDMPKQQKITIIEHLIAGFWRFDNPYERMALFGVLAALRTTEPQMKEELDFLGQIYELRSDDKTKHRSAGYMGIRAQRYMEKRLLRDLWRAWRKVQMVAA